MNLFLGSMDILGEEEVNQVISQKYDNVTPQYESLLRESARLVSSKKPFQIWVGYYHLGQGDHGSVKPEHVATVEARSFQLACYLFELETTLKYMKELNDSNEYLDKQSFHFWYNPTTVSNNWTGKYYQTEEEALLSFKKN